jgi:hypothetical protein
MIKLHQTTHKIDTIFVLALFTIFAATAFLVILIGARQYQVTADNMDYNYQVRTASSYLEEKIRQNDAYGQISIGSLSGTPALVLSSTEGENTYSTYIYCYEGNLRELFIMEGAAVGPEAGQKIMELKDFDAEYVSANLLKVTFTNKEGTVFPVYLSIHANDPKEDL